MTQREFEVAFAEACYYAIEKHRPMLIRPVITLARDRLDPNLVTTYEKVIARVDSIFQQIRDEHPTMRKT